MSQTKTWRELQAERRLSPEYRAAYEQTKRRCEIGAQVRTLREARGVSQSELAKRMGASQPMIARLEAGGAEPRIDTLARVAAALDAELAVTLNAREHGVEPGREVAARA